MKSCTWPGKNGRPIAGAGVYTDEFYEETAGFARETLAGDPSGTSVLGEVLSIQYRRWLPANINLKQDRLCMAHGIENRVPFLDHRFVEFMATAPDRLDALSRICEPDLKLIWPKEEKKVEDSVRNLSIHDTRTAWMG